MRTTKPSVSIKREEILDRDGRRCHYCHHPLTLQTMHVDHVVPVSRGGGDDPKNLVASCPACNISKGSRTPDEWKPEFVFENGSDIEAMINEWDKAFRIQAQAKIDTKRKILRLADKNIAAQQASFDKRSEIVSEKEKILYEKELHLDELIDSMVVDLQSDAIELSDDEWDDVLSERIADEIYRIEHPVLYENEVERR